MFPNDRGVPGEMAGAPHGSLMVGPSTAVMPAHAGLPAWRAQLPIPAQAVLPEADTGRFLRVLRRRWQILVGVGSILAVAAGVAAWFLMAPKYTAYALVHVAAQPPRTLGLPGDSSDARTDFAAYQRLQAARIKSRYVLNAALNREEIRRFDLEAHDPNALAWLDEELKVETKEGSELLTVSMSGRDPDKLLALVNGVTRAYLQEVVSVDSKHRAERVAEIEQIYNASTEKLREKRTMLHNLADQVGTSDSQALSQKQVTMLANFGEVKKQQIQIRSDRMRAETRLAAARGRARQAVRGPTKEAIDRALQADPVAKDYLKHIAELQEIIAQYELTAVHDDEPGLLTARARKRGLEQSLKSRRAELEAEQREHVQQTSQSESEADLAQLEQEVKTLSEQEAFWNGEVDKAARDLQRVGGASTEVEMLRVEIGLEEKVAERIWDKLEALRYELHSPERITLFQEAVLQPLNRKRQYVAAGLAPLGVLFLVGFCISWWDLRDRRIQDVSEVRVLGMKFMGAVPPLPPAAARQRLAMGGEEHRVYGPTFMESIDAIRTLLLRDASREGLRLLMVTSAVEGEAKTTLATHLATSLARSGRKTLLIDCDLRRPTLQDSFEVSLQPGFSELLLGQADPVDAVRDVGNGLAVLPAGQWDREVLRILAKEGAQKLFDRLKQDFDFIIVDSHPVLAATDSLLIGQNMDGVVFSLLRDRSQVHVVYAACERLSSLGIKVLGAVVNGIDHDALFDQFSHSLPRYPRL